jgi:Domain of unknown function (DUF222)
MFDMVVRLGDRLATLLDGLDPDAVSGSAAGQMWAALDRVERVAAGGKTLLARRVADTHQPDRDGARSAAEALARRAGTTVGAARDAVDTSTRLRRLPLVDAAVRRGDLSAAQAAAVSAAAAAAANPATEQRLLELAATASLPELREECARVTAAADPDPAASNARLHRRRALRRFTDPDGAWTLIAKGTPQAGAAINTALDPIIDGVFRQARTAGRHEPYEAYAFDALLTLATGHCPTAGQPMPMPGVNPSGLSGAARAAMTAGPTAESAVGSGVDGSAAAAEPATGGQPVPIAAGPAINPGGEDDNWHAHPSAVADPTRPTAPPATATPPPTAAPPRPNPRYLALLRVDLEALRRGGVAGDEMCEITGVGPVPVPVARGLLGEAVLKLVITRGVDVCTVTHLGRGPTAAQRVALAWASPGCTVEGCWRTRIEYDHCEPWSRTRRTRLNELDPLCEFHHDLKTRHGWALVSGHGKRAMVPPDNPRHPRHQQKLRARTDRDTGGQASSRVRALRPAMPEQSAPP